MEQKKQSRKVSYTQNVLRQSLLHLMKTRPIEKITVTEICLQADINRGTFYSYYQHPFDLLTKIEDALYDELLACVKRPAQIPPGTMTEFMLQIYELILKHKDIFLVLAGAYGDPKFLRKCMMVKRQETIEDWQKSAPQFNKTELEYIHDAIAVGNMSMIELWINKNFQESPQTLAALSSKLNTHGMAAFFGEIQQA